MTIIDLCYLTKEHYISMDEEWRCTPSGMVGGTTVARCYCGLYWQGSGSSRLARKHLAEVKKLGEREADNEQ